MRLLQLLLLGMLISAPLLPAAPVKPNIIFLFADDLGWGDLGCYGHPYARTPNIDKLAKEGARFMQFYATGVTCCPSRTGFMTSWLPARYATYPANGGFGDRVTITQLLKSAGYATGHFGKWHIGPEMNPGTYGIDETSAGEDKPGKGKAKDDRGRDAPIYDQAIQFIERHRGEPFYLNVWGHIAHHPIHPPQNYIDQFQGLTVEESKLTPSMKEKFTACTEAGGDAPQRLRNYLADVKSMDDDVGRLLAKLDELNLRENTLVVFSSDQGPALLREDDEDGKRKKEKSSGRDDLRLNSMGSTGSLRGAKHAMYEGGVRIPFIIRWPGHVPAGHVDAESVCSGADWLPTLCKLTGTPLPDLAFDGEDISATWLGRRVHTREKPLFWKTSAPGSDAGVREGQWKLIYPTRKNGGPIQLYDVVADPTESSNLAEQRPEIVERLSLLARSWVSTLPKEYVKTKDKDD